MDSETRDAFWQAVAESPFMMVGRDGGLSQPMTAMLDKTADHAIWFFASRKGALGPGGSAEIVYVSRGHGLFASLSGTLSIESDRATFEKHWSNQVEAWFPGGRSDPDLMFLRYDIEASEVWKVDRTITGMFRMLTGRPMQPQESGQHGIGRV